jgi:hypothetical protein
MLEEELQDVADKALPKKNLRISLMSLCILLLSGFAYFQALDSFSPRRGTFIPLLWALFHYLFEAIAFAFAVLSLRGSLRSLRTTKDARNYIALAFSILIALIVLYDFIFGTLRVGYHIYSGSGNG